MSDANGASQRRSLRDWIGDLFGDEPEDRDDLMAILRDAARRQIMDTEALNIIHGALQVADQRARDIMIPRTRMVTLSVDATLEDLLPVIIAAQHSRYPVIGEALDDVRGILHAKDLLPALARGLESPFDIKDHIRPATVIPESKRLNVLLQDFRKARNHMAIVVDEYGHVAGIVTIEDVLEQIVGDIEDEHDVEDEHAIRQMDAVTYTVKADTPIEDFNEALGSAIDDRAFDTVGGLVLHAFGALPARGDSIDFGGLRFTVMSADSRRLRLLQVERLQPHPPHAADA
ncbi:MAG: HlyC/CorC family transporter [Gammaproteobacteria bacterium]